MGIRQDTFDLQVLYTSAITLHQQDEFARAINLYYQVLDHTPESAEVYYNLGLAWQSLEKLDEAIEVYQRAAELAPEDSDILYNLGLAYKMAKRFDDAEKSYLQALEHTDDIVDILYNLACCYQDSGAVDQACLVFSALLEQQPDHLPSLNNYAYLQHMQQNFDSALNLYKRILELDPDRPSAQYMHQVLSGKNTEAPPPQYVQELFDQYSDNFEENLVKDLNYNTYCILRQAVDNLVNENKQFDHGLDLGCGTGLAGKVFHSLCSRLAGIDLSQNMLRQAEQKQVYSSLHCQDILEFLKETDKQFDLIIAADVLPYLGPLDALFNQAGQRVAPGSFFCLSSEETENPGWILQRTGRYAHHPDYIMQTAEKEGWIVLDQFRAHMRREKDTWIKGTILVLEKT